MKKKFILANLFLLMFIPFVTNAEELTERWIESNSAFNGVTATSDGGYITISESDDIVKYDWNGNVVWQKNFDVADCDEGFNDIKETSDGGFIVVGYTDLVDEELDNGEIDDSDGYNAYIVKIDKDGNIEWQDSYAGPLYVNYDSVTPTSDGGYVAIGYINSVWIDLLEFTSGSGDGLIVKYDKNGNVEWTDTYGGTTGWLNSYGDYGSGDRFFDVTTTNDGGYIVVGSTGSDDIDAINLIGYDDALIIKYDKNGNVVWQKNYGGNYYDLFYAVAKNIDGEYVVVGSVYSSDVEGITLKGDKDAIIVKYDESGNMKWQNNYGGNSSEEFNDVSSTTDGGFAVAGYTASTDIEGIANNGRIDAIIVKYDKEGKIDWQRNYGSEYGYEEFYKVTTTTDNGYVVVGNPKQGDLLQLYTKYNLTKEESKNGTFEVIQEANKGKITIKPDKGYELDKIIIKDIEGNTLKYYEENGNYYFDLSNDVTIEVLFKEIVNPSTGINNPYIASILILLIVSTSIYIVRKKKYL